MANNKIQVKRTSTSGRTPNTTNSGNAQYIAAGELALNMADGILYSSNGSTVIEVGANNTNVQVTGNLTVNAIIANGSIGSAGQTLTSNGTSVYWAAGSGTGTVTSIDSGDGLTGGPITTTGTLSVGAANGITVSADAVGVTQGTGVVVNATGVHVNSTYIGTLSANNANFVKANNGITSNSSGVFVTEGTGVVVNATGVHVNSTYIGTLTANNTNFVGAVSAANVVSNSQLSANLANYQTTVGLSANVATLTSNNSTFAYGKTEGNLNVNNALTANNADYLGTVAAASYVQNTDSRTLSGNLVISGTYFNPSTNTVLLGNSTQRWVISANTINSTGGITSTSNITSNNITITNDLEVGRNITVQGNLTIIGTSTTLQGNVVTFTDNMLYLNQGILATITNITGNGTYVVFTANNNFSAGWDVTVTGVTPSSYNGTYQNIFAANSTTFTVANTNTDAYTSGGTARGKTDQNPDIGFAAGYNDGTYHHTGFFRDATDSYWKVFEGYDPEPDSSVDIDTSNASFTIAKFWADTIRIGNTSVYATVNSTSFSATANNASNLGGVAAASYQLNSTLSANVATLTSNNTSFVGSVSAANVVSNAQLSSNLANYQTTAGLSANVATLTSNNSTNLGGIAAANYARVDTADSFDAVVTFNANVVMTKALSANGGFGSAGQVLTSGAAGNVYWSTVGDITSVTAGNGLTGGGTSGDVTLTVGAGNGIVVNTTAVAVGGAVSGVTTLTAGNTTLTGWISAQSAIIEGGGSYIAGSIYSDANWGMLFRARQASPVAAQFGWKSSDDTSEYMRISPTGNVGIGNTAPAHKLSVNGTTNLAGAVTGITTLAAGNTTITGFSNVTSDGQFTGSVGIGIAPSSTAKLYVACTAISQDATYYGILSQFNDANTAITANRNRYSSLSIIENNSENKTSGGATTYNSSYIANYGLARNGGDTTGGDARAVNVEGGRFYAYQYANGLNSNTVSALVGTRSAAIQQGSGVVTGGYGLLGSVEAANSSVTGNVTTAYGVYSTVKSNTSMTIDTGYLYYGQHLGSTTTAQWGVYLTGEDKNYFSGNVGIGNTTPAHKLSVNGTTNLAGAVTGITTLAAGNTTITGFANVSSNLMVGSAPTTSPSALATIVSGTTVGQNYQISLAPVDGALGRESGIRFGATFSQGWAGVDYVARYSGAISYGAAGGGATPRLHAMKFYTGDGSDVPTERVRIDASGNVGIGNTSPTHKLSVNGTTYTGNTTITGFANVSTSVNTASYTVGTTVVANTSGTYATHVDGVDGVNVSKRVCYLDNTGASDANYWAKIMTVSTGTTQYIDATFLLAITNLGTDTNDSAIISVFFRANATSANPTVDVEIVSKSGTDARIGPDSFKVISGGWSTDMELWMQKKQNYGGYAVYEISRSSSIAEANVVYNTTPVWQLAEPTGAVNNVKSDGVVTTKLSVNGALSVSQNTTFSNGVNFGSAVAGAVDTLSRHINLWGGIYGLSITGNQLNVVTGRDVVMYNATTELLRANTTGTYVGTRFLANGSHANATHLNGKNEAALNVNNATYLGTVISTSYARTDIAETFNSTVRTTGLGVGLAAVSGEIVCSGDITAFATSDKRLKTNIVPIEDALGKLKKITGVMFDWTDEEVERKGGEKDNYFRRHDTGVIAQDVEEVLPEVVVTRDNGYKAVKYEKLAGLIIQAINELSEQVNDLKKEIKDLKE